jgi:hypothetical protein
MADTEVLVPDTTQPAQDFEKGWETHTEKFAEQADAMGSQPEAQNEPTGTITTADQRDEAGKFKAKSDKAKHNPVKRMLEATAKEAEAKALYETAQARIKALEDENTSLKRPRTEEARPEAKSEAKAEPKEPIAGFTRPRPKIADFLTVEEQGLDPFEEWNDALIDWKEEQREAKKEYTKQQETFRSTMQTAADRMDEARTGQPDFKALEQAADQTVRSAGFLVSDGRGGKVPGLPPALLTALAHSEHIVSLTRHFGTHPEVLSQWIRETAALPASAATVVQRGLESLVSAGTGGAKPDSVVPARAAISKAKPPIDRVGGSASATQSDPDDLPFEEFVRKR